MSENLPAVMTAKEVADFLRLSAKFGEQTIRRMARLKKLKGFLVGNRWRFSRNVVMDYAHPKGTP